MDIAGGNGFPWATLGAWGNSHPSPLEKGKPVGTHPLASPIVVALGGNAIIIEGEEGNLEQQWRHTRETMDELASLIEGLPDQPFVITHGNGPQVGNIILRAEIAAPYIFSIPLDVAVADSEGAMGYMIQVALQNALAARGLLRPIVTIITQTVVDPDDPAFQNPTKFIGGHYDETGAERQRRERGWVMRRVDEKNWRRVVASPRPVKIVEIDAVKALVSGGVVVIAAGGGGIPVAVNERGEVRGVEAVIDKDLASALLATQLAAERLVVLTGSDGVWERWGRPDGRRLPEMDRAEAHQRFDAGEFPPGSMGPKIQAALEFLERGGREVFIGRPGLLADTLDGRAGTRIHRSDSI